MSLPTATVYAGGPRTARVAQIDRLLAEHWGQAILIVPTRAAARERLERILRTRQLPGCLGKPVLDFKAFVEDILRAEGEHPVNASDLHRRLALESALRARHGANLAEAAPDPTSSRGLLDHLLEVITQIKQAAIEPAAFRACILSASAPNPLDSMIADAYEAYQERLIARDLYDVPGLYWRAHDLAVATAPRALDGVRLLLFDGFDDFTPSELRLITALAPHVPRLVFGLAFDPISDRRDLFHLARRTLERIREHFDVTLPELESAPAQTLSQYLADQFFWRSRPPACAGLPCDVRLLACIDVQHEAETLARQVHALLAQGVVPARMAIIYRSLSAAAPWLRATLAEYQIPAQFSQGKRLRDTLPARTLCATLGVADRWDREEVAELIASVSFAPGNQCDPLWADAARIARRAGILDGRLGWLQRLAWYRQNARHTDERAAAGALENAVQRLGHLLEALPDRVPLPEHCAAMAKLLEGLGVGWAIAQLQANHAPGAEEECAALRGLLQVLGNLAESSSDHYSREAFQSLLEQALQDTATPANPQRGGVLVLEAAAARHLDFDYVFYGGLNEGAVPQPAALNAIYGESERARLDGLGIPLDRREDRAAREAALFHHVLGLPRAGLILSYQLNQGGREAAPSPYYVQVRDLLARDHPEALAPPPLADAFLPDLDAAASVREVRNAAFHARASGLNALFAGPARGALLERARYDAADFGCFDGVLDSATARAYLMERFGPAHVFSVAQLEDYTACPFQFLLKRVLRVEEEEPPEGELDSMTRGELMHRILRLFHERNVGKSVAELAFDQAHAQMSECTEQAFSEARNKLQSVPTGVLHAERTRLERVLRRYLVHAATKHGDTWKPLHFEVPFGPVRNDAGEREDQPPLALSLSHGSVLLSGRIDRIDRDGDRLRLIDYKSGGLPAAKLITAGTSLQLALYALACEQMLYPGAQCSDALYVRVGGAKDQPGLKARGVERLDITDSALRGVERALQGIRAGVFPPMPAVATCYGCTTAHICRHERARIERKPRPELLVGVEVESPDEDEAT